MTVRVVFADDNYLVREGRGRPPRRRRPRSTSSRSVADPTRCCAAVADAPCRTPCSPTSGCRRRSPPRASTRPSRSGRSFPETGVVCGVPDARGGLTPSQPPSTGLGSHGYPPRSVSPRSTTWSRRSDDAPRAAGSALDLKIVQASAGALVCGGHLGAPPGSTERRDEVLLRSSRRGSGGTLSWRRRCSTCSEGAVEKHVGSASP